MSIFDEHFLYDILYLFDSRDTVIGAARAFEDSNNLIGDPASVAELDGVLIDHCAAIGRDEREIERTVALRWPIIRDDRADATQARTKMLEAHSLDPSMVPELAGTPEDLAEYLAGYVDVGYHHIIAGLLAPYDEETMTRLITEVRPRLEAMVA